jgi:hypothetical protein
LTARYLVKRFHDFGQVVFTGEFAQQIPGLVASLSIGRHSSPMLVLYRLCGTKAVFDPRDLCT